MFAEKGKNLWAYGQAKSPPTPTPGSPPSTSMLERGPCSHRIKSLKEACPDSFGVHEIGMDVMPGVEREVYVLGVFD